MRYDSIRAAPGSQPGVVDSSGEHQDRRATINLILDLARDAHAAGRNRFPVENGQVDVAGVQVLNHHRLGGALDIVKATQIRMRPGAECCNDTRPGVGVVAVYQDLDRVR